MGLSFSTIVLVLGYGVIIPIITSIVFLKKITNNFKLLVVLIVVSFISNLISRYLGIRGINNLYINHIYTFIEFVILSLFYSNYLSNIVAKKYFYFAIITYTIFAILSTLFFQKVNVFNDLTRAVEAFFMIVLSALYFYKKIRFEEDLQSDPVFWVNIGVLFYFTSNFLLFASSNIVLTLPMKSIKVLWLIHAVFLEIYYLSITIGFIKCKKLEYSR